MNPYYNEMNETRAFPFYGGFGYGMGFPGYGWGFPGYGFGWGYRPWFRPFGWGFGYPWI